MAAAGLITLAAGCFVVGTFDPERAGIFPSCPLLTITGIACPGCGLTRGFHELFHGNFISALDYNAMVPIYALVFAFLAVLFFSIAARGRSLKFTILTPASLIGFLSVSAVFAVIRNLPIEPLNVLYP